MRVDVILTQSGAAIPRLPPNPATLPSVFGDRVLEIHENVYALWEIPPGEYLLHAISVAGYAGAYLAQAQGNDAGGMGVSRALRCVPDTALFLAVGDVGFHDALVIRDLDRNSGAEYVRKSLRSAGVYAGAPGYRDCELQWPLNQRPSSLLARDLACGYGDAEPAHAAEPHQRASPASAGH